MSKIRLGYGSEWQMLRMLGRHRDWFTQQVLRSTGGTSLIWKDFDFTASAGEAGNFGDAEIKGLNFLPAGHTAQVAWRAWWPQSGNVHNWDAVGVLDRDGAEEWVLVEAKGNREELLQSTTAKSKVVGGGLEQIEECLAETQKFVGITEPKVWTTPYYQYANRLALLHFLAQQSVAARMVFVYFTGDATQGRKCPATEADWRPALDAMKKQLGLTGVSSFEKCVHEVFVDVCPKKNSKRPPMS
ncbi:MAG: hypothetical protein WKF77_12380 [Planctomycetaceae bacterium]